MRGNSFTRGDMDMMRISKGSVIFVQSLVEHDSKEFYDLDFGKVVYVSRRSPNRFSVRRFSMEDIEHEVWFPSDKKIVRAVDSDGEIIVEGSWNRIREWYRQFGEFRASVVDASVKAGSVYHESRAKLGRQEHMMRTYGVYGKDEPMIGVA